MSKACAKIQEECPKPAQTQFFRGRVNRELKRLAKKGAVETGVKSGLKKKRRINRELEAKIAHKP